MVWVEMIWSLGSGSLSSSSTETPARLSRVASDAPAHRAPTITTSYSAALIRSLLPAVYVGGPLWTTDITIQLGIGGLIDLAYAPLADEGGDVVMAESGADF